MKEFLGVVVRAETRREHALARNKNGVNVIQNTASMDRFLKVYLIQNFVFTEQH
jgi:hypothetical protein